ncbi:hypothetical protein MD484_g8346, partial [Candolleomyces efflorescens]
MSAHGFEMGSTVQGGLWNSDNAMALNTGNGNSDPLFSGSSAFDQGLGPGNSFNANTEMGQLDSPPGATQAPLGNWHQPPPDQTAASWQASTSMGTCDTFNPPNAESAGLNLAAASLNVPNSDYTTQFYTAGPSQRDLPAWEDPSRRVTVTSPNAIDVPQWEANPLLPGRDFQNCEAFPAPLSNEANDGPPQPTQQMPSSVLSNGFNNPPFGTATPLTGNQAPTIIPDYTDNDNLAFAENAQPSQFPQQPLLPPQPITNSAQNFSGSEPSATAPPVPIIAYLLQQGAQAVSHPPNGAQDFVSQVPTQPMGQSGYCGTNMNGSPAIARMAPGGNLATQRGGPFLMIPPQAAAPTAMHHQLQGQQVQSYQGPVASVSRPVQHNIVPQMRSAMHQQFVSRPAALANPRYRPAVRVPNRGRFVARAKTNIQNSSARRLAPPPRPRRRVVMLNGKLYQVCPRAIGRTRQPLASIFQKGGSGQAMARRAALAGSHRPLPRPVVDARLGRISRVVPQPINRVGQQPAFTQSQLHAIYDAAWRRGILRHQQLDQSSPTAVSRPQQRQANHMPLDVVNADMDTDEEMSVNRGAPRKARPTPSRDPNESAASRKQGVERPTLKIREQMEVMRKEKKAQGSVRQAKPDSSDQSSNRRSGERRLGTHQQQAEEVQGQSAFPQKLTNSRNGGRHQGDGRTSRAPLSGSSKRTRDESEDEEEDMQVDEPSSLSKKQQPKVVQEQIEGPFTFEVALQIALSGRRCQWNSACNEKIEARPGAYWEHVRTTHSPWSTTDLEDNHAKACQVHGCTTTYVRPSEMSSHLDGRCHRVDELKVVCWDTNCRLEWTAENLHSLAKHYLYKKKRHLDRRFGVVVPYVPLKLPSVEESVTARAKQEKVKDFKSLFDMSESEQIKQHEWVAKNPTEKLEPGYKSKSKSVGNA